MSDDDRAAMESMGSIDHFLIAAGIPDERRPGTPTEAWTRHTAAELLQREARGEIGSAQARQEMKRLWEAERLKCLNP